MVKKYRRGFIIKKDILQINGQEAQIEVHKNIYSARFPTYRLEFFKIRGSFPPKYFIGNNKYSMKWPYLITTIKSNDTTFKLKWKRPYYRIYVDGEEIASMMVNTRAYGDVTLACTNLEYQQACKDLALVVSLRNVENKSAQNLYAIYSMLIFAYFFFF